MINETKTNLLNKEKYFKYINKIYANGWIANNTSMVRRFEERLAEYLGIKGFAITTPFSFVATTSSLVTNGILSIHVDIDPENKERVLENYKKCFSLPEEQRVDSLFYEDTISGSEN